MNTISEKLDEESNELTMEDKKDNSKDYKPEIVWKNVILQFLLHSFIFIEIWYLYRYPEERSNSGKLWIFSEYKRTMRIFFRS